jgi:hypothetical protein
MPEEFKPYKHDNVIGDYYKHPTFGIISFNRSQGTSRPLFGSSILHSNTISVEISRAELCRGLNDDHIFDRDLIVRAEMSTTQFADAITGMNVGCGIPVTLRYIAQNSMENLGRIDPPYQNKVEQFNNEFDKDCKDLAKNFDTVIKLAEETHAQKRLVQEIKMLRQTITSTLPFINKQFSEQMEHTVKEAKGEVEAFVTHTVQSYGLEAIRKQAPQLPESTIINTNLKELPQGK